LCLVLADGARLRGFDSPWAYRQAVAIAQQAKDRFRKAATLYDIAAVYQSQVKYDQARVGYGQALAVAREGNIGELQDAISSALQRLP